ncbi:MAG: hypothetical protein ABIN01_17015 [Ferruginibacter sp.]
MTISFQYPRQIMHRKEWLYYNQLRNTARDLKYFFHYPGHESITKALPLSK